MNIFTYIQHLYTAFVLCKCVLTYIFSNYYKINKGRQNTCLPRVLLGAIQYTRWGRGWRGGLRLSTNQEILVLSWEGDMFPTV